MKFGKVIMTEVFLVNLFDLGMACSSFYEGRYDWQTVLKIFMIALGLQLSLLLHYLMSKRRLFYSTTYATIQTLSITVLMIEKALIRPTTLEEVSTLFVTISALCCSFSVLSYDFSQFLYGYIAKALYTLLRLFLHFEPPLEVTIRASVHYFAALICIVWFAR